MLLGNMTTVGVDLGTTGMRAVEIGWKDGKPFVARWTAFDFETPVLDWSVVDTGELGQKIRLSLERSGIRGPWAAHGIAGEAVAPQYFNFPKLLPEDVEEAVRIEVEAGLPFRAEDALISYVCFPDQRSGTGHAVALDAGEGEAAEAPAPMEVGPDVGAEVADAPEGGPQERQKTRTHGIAIAADNGLVESRLEVLRQAGLEAFCVEPDATACANAYVATDNTNAVAGTTAILNVGYRFSNIALVHDGTLLVRDVPCGGHELTRAISQTLSMQETEAERQKRAHWRDGPKAAGAIGDRMGEIVETGLRELSDRLQDSIQYWVGERLVPNIDRMLLTGGGAQVRELPEILSKALDLPVERWFPAQLPKGKKNEQQAWDARLTTAFGLALRRFPRK